MALLKEPLTKLYYSISEVADMFAVSKSLIRFWESEFDILRPHKTSKGDRRFTKKNIEQFRLIYELVKEKGFTLKGAKRELTEKKEVYQRKQKAIQTLKKIKARLEDLRLEL